MRDWKMTWITQAAIDEQKRADAKRAAEFQQDYKLTDEEAKVVHPRPPPPAKSK